MTTGGIKISIGACPEAVVNVETTSRTFRSDLNPYVHPASCVGKTSEFQVNIKARCVYRLYCTIKRTRPIPAEIAAKSLVPLNGITITSETSIINPEGKPTKRIPIAVVLQSIADRICNGISLPTTGTFVATRRDLIDTVAIVATRTSCA